MASVALEGVRKVYGNGQVAVDGASFEVADGELMVLVGPSGCGKSTTLRMLAGLESVSEGTIRIDGRVVNDVAPKDRDVAMVFQNYALYPHMTVFDNMAFGLRLRKYPKSAITERVEQAAETLGIKEILTRKPKQLSGGQQQRVAVGRAIVRKPKVFLFDEPLSNLDARLRVQMRTELARLHRELRATMVYVTHDQTEAMTLGDRIVVMNGGRIQQVDTPIALYARPCNRFVAGFIGSPAMNFVKGHIVSDRGGLHVVSEGGDVRLVLSDRIEACADQKVVIGIRPEDLSISNSGPRPVGYSSVGFEVILKEQLGAETRIYGKTASGTLMARVGGSTSLTLGTNGRFAVHHKAVHVFDAVSGTTLTEGGREAV